MNKHIFMAGLAVTVALTGCSKSEEPTVDETAVAAPAEPAMMEQTTPGTYEVTDADGKTTMTTINADGTFQSMDGDKVMAKGTVTRAGGKDCFTGEGEGGPMCYTYSEPDADGAFTVTADDGRVETVRPVAQ